MWPFRSAMERIAMLREIRKPAPPMWQIPAEPPARQPDHGKIYVYPETADHTVSIRIMGLGHFALSRKAAFSFARQIEGAADALGPEPKAADESVDVPIGDGDGNE
jgi:hypothetical protein